MKERYLVVLFDETNDREENFYSFVVEGKNRLDQTLEEYKELTLVSEADLADECNLKLHSKGAGTVFYTRLG